MIPKSGNRFSAMILVADEWFGWVPVSVPTKVGSESTQSYTSEAAIRRYRNGLIPYRRDHEPEQQYQELKVQQNNEQKRGRRRCRNGEKSQRLKIIATALLVAGAIAVVAV
jgi:hypothetical protein